MSNLQRKPRYRSAWIPRPSRWRYYADSAVKPAPNQSMTPGVEMVDAESWDMERPSNRHDHHIFVNRSRA